MSAVTSLPLSGVRVLDFSTLLPGPLATLILAEAGAEIIKIERPGKGEDMRHYPPHINGESINFALLNRGKTTLALDLKDERDCALLRSQAKDCHIVVDQFRPGVLDRLGLGYNALKGINPGIVYCAITGYGQDGPNTQKAGHDLNYIAESGLLALSADKRGTPVIPPGLIADIGGGAYPAVMNILLALRQAERTGEGCKLDISMTDNLGPWMWWAHATLLSGKNPMPGGELLSGGSPRYQIYRTKDDRYLAVAALEQKFWDRFCELVKIPETLKSPDCSPEKAIQSISELIRQQTSNYWATLFDGEDVCCSIVAPLAEAQESPQYHASKSKGGDTIMAAGAVIPALPLPLDPQLRRPAEQAQSPVLPTQKTDH